MRDKLGPSAILLNVNKKPLIVIPPSFDHSTVGESMKFQPPSGHPQLHQHISTPIRRHVKVQAKRSPYDGVWIDWATRLGRSPDVSTKVARLLRNQRARCIECGLYFRDGETMHIERINPDANRRNAHYDLLLLHRYCRQRRDEANGLAGAYDKR